MKTIVFLFLIQLCFFAKAQYPPAAGQAGSTAIAHDSSCFIDWSTGCSIVRGFVNISDTTILAASSNRATYGAESDVAGIADNVVVSLGDGGIADIFFTVPLSDGNGFDFAVFENPLTDTFLELAFIEVSSDGIHFFRIPAYSLTDTVTQTNGFGATDPTKIHNLAGKYRALFGTPFDIAEAPDTALLRKDSITVVRLIDVIGSIDPIYASRDFENRIVNDPFPTPFESCGFDLDAVGVINNRSNTGFDEYRSIVHVYPDPARDVIHFSASVTESIYIYSCSGHLMREYSGSEKSADVSALNNGIYFLITSEGRSAKFIVCH
ncbi:MAG TPA: T9SS type A sorting domain-containing protein [Bacteroidales bacterium]|nr:T9SS type A sorting domain-containing protein [Bacteroidales bacterium]